MKNYVNRCLTISLILLVGPSALAQKESYNRQEFFRVPDDFAIVMLAARANGPISIEEVQIFTNQGGSRIKCGYRFRNRGNVAVRAVSITVITNFLFRPTGGGRLETYIDIVGLDKEIDGKTRFLGPGEIMSVREDLNKRPRLEDSIIAEIRKQPSRIQAKFVVALVVSKIELVDGKIIDFKSDANDLERIFTDGIGVR